MSHFDLSGRIALVTGGGRGIGAAIVTRFAEVGATVAIANRTPEYARDLAAALQVRGLAAEVLPFASTARAELAALVDGVAERHGRLDILVHNAGGCPWATLEELSEDKLSSTLDINLNAFVWLVQAAAPHMKRGGFGRILATSSVSARLAMAGGAHYSAAKAGLNAFIRGAAFELARDGITVNGVEPGFIAKPGRGRMGSDAVRARIGAYTPLGRMGEPDDVAFAMLYLASSEAKYTTGQTIVVDGGSTLPETGYAVEDRWGID